MEITEISDEENEEMMELSPPKRQKIDDEASFLKAKLAEMLAKQSAVSTASKVAKPVILTTGLCDDYMERLRDRCSKNGGKIVKTMSHAVTHVVTQACTNRMETRRTLKYLQGILSKCWVVDFSCM